jgi:hypothetical protein
VEDGRVAGGREEIKEIGTGNMITTGIERELN